MRMAVAAGVAVVMAATGGTVWGQEIVRVPRGNWAITLPAGWSWDADKSVDELNSANAKQLRGTGIDVPRYVLRAAKDGDPSVYVLVQEQKALPEGSTFRQVERAYTTETMEAAGDQAGQAYGGISMRVISSEADNTTRTCTTVSEIRGPEGALATTSTLHFAKDRVLTLHSYAPLEAPESDFAALRGIQASFGLDAGQAYQFRSGGLSSGAVGAISGGIAAAVVGVWRRRRGA